MMDCQVCLNDPRFTSVDIDVGEPLVQGRWKNFRKPRKWSRKTIQSLFDDIDVVVTGDASVFLIGFAIEFG